jgi:DNA-binding MarR family transcriptional regulator
MNTPSKEDREGSATLEILNTISAQHDITQRHLADRLGVALGLANSYLKRCVKKGFVKIQQAPANRYLYYVTPQGFAEKSRLTAEYLSYSFDFYRSASTDMLSALEACCADNAKTVLFAGLSELAEIGSIRAEEIGLRLVGTYDAKVQNEHFVGRPVWRDWNDIESFDACVLTSLAPSEALYAELIKRCGISRVYVPEVVRPLTSQTMSMA